MANLNSNLSSLATRVGQECKALYAAIEASATAVKNDLLGGAGTAYDTLKELADLIETNRSAIDALEALAAGHVKFDEAQTLTDAQKTQALNNIGATSAADVTALTSRVTTAEGKITTAESNIETNTTNIATNTASISALTTNIGDTDTNFVTVFETALNATS